MTSLPAQYSKRSPSRSPHSPTAIEGDSAAGQDLRRALDDTHPHPPRTSPLAHTDSTTMADAEESPAQRQARLRREKREKKILSGGNDRLAKITGLSGRTMPPGTCTRRPCTPPPILQRSFPLTSPLQSHLPPRNNLLPPPKGPSNPPSPTTTTTPTKSTFAAHPTPPPSPHRHRHHPPPAPPRRTSAASSVPRKQQAPAPATAKRGASPT
jgi:hypothetical protein